MKGGGGGRTNYSRTLNTNSDYGDRNSTGGSGGGRVVDDCDEINFLTWLHNLQPAINGHVVGDILNVELGVNNTIVVTEPPTVCGTIVDPIVVKLRECINNGKKFKAVITNISANSCEVRIRKTI